MLLLELAFKLDVFFLQLTDQVPLQLDFLDHLEEISVSLVGSLGLLVLLSLNLVDGKDERLDVLLVLVVLLLESVDDLLLAEELVAVLFVVLLHLHQRGLQSVTVTFKLHDGCLLLVSLLLKPVEVTEEVVHVALSLVLLGDGVDLLLCETLLVVFKLAALTFDLSLGALHFSEVLRVPVQLLLLLGILARLLAVILLQAHQLVLLLVKTVLEHRRVLLDLVAVLLKVKLVLLEAGDLFFHVLDLILELIDLGIQLVFGLLERVGATLELFFSALHLVFLIFYQAMLLNQILKLRLLLMELELDLVVLLGKLGLGCLRLGERLDLGVEFPLVAVLLLEHLLHVVLGAH